MPRLYEYVLPARKLTREAFAEAHPYPFLLFHHDPADVQDDWTFKTQTISVTSAKLAKLAITEDLKLSPELARYDVFPVVKAMNNPWHERVSVGRARNNDIVLADSSVSKLHAHFRRGDGAEMILADAGSRNGTRLNQRRLEAGEAVKVSIGDTVSFGRTSMTFLDAQSLHDLVSKHMQRNGESL